MRSIADDLRAESRRDDTGRTPAERIELALRLGEEDVALLSAARGVPLEEAARRIARSRQTGRISSIAGDPFGGSTLL